MKPRRTNAFACAAVVLFFFYKDMAFGMGTGRHITESQG